MKIRSKCSQGHLAENVDPAAVTVNGKTVKGWMDRHVPFLGGDERFRFYPESLWDLIPEERWEDISSQCRVCPREVGQTLMHIEHEDSAGVIGPFLAKIKDGYRLRKVRDCDPMPSVAFIVERKVG